MSTTAQRDDPGLWERVKAEVTEGDKGGHAGEWSARKAQLAVAEYKKRGGGYIGGKRQDNSLHEWTEEEWGTRSGEESGATGERYLPKAVRETLSDDEYARTTARKRRDTKKGKQFSAQPPDVREKTAAIRHGEHTPTKAFLMNEARKRGVPGRSTMNKAELSAALKR